MKQQDFEEKYSPLWIAFERWLGRAGQKKNRSNSGDTAGIPPLKDEDVPRAYRQVCHHLALCRSRTYSPSLESRLNRLALDGHRQLYATSTSAMSGFTRFFARDFPRAVRREWVFVLIMALIFYGSLGGTIAAIAINPPIVYSIMSPMEAAEFERMYDPASRRIGERDSGDDFMMFGYYIYNNIGIGFGSFASGLALGIGPLLVTLFNGVFIGAVMGHLSVNGLGTTLWSFVVGHGAFELNAIVLAAAGGLKLGYSVIAPGRRSRRTALYVAAQETMPLVFGFTAMLLGAAFIEAFWSSTRWPSPTAKYVVGAILWTLTLAYFAFAGRTRGS